MTNSRQTTLRVALIVGIAVLVGIGLRVAPIEQASNSAEARNECKFEGPDEWKPTGREWCANGLFARVAVTSAKEDVIAVAHFSANGAHVWQLQSTNLINSFRQLTDKIAARAKDRNVSVSVQNPDETRVVACARLSSEAAAACEAKK
ncbi:MAG: hypothetical protein ABIS29_00690 [Vicinamibacterales bacterium]